ncbi:MAG: alpha-L-fucosidase [Dysgonamonadaceae bacterium]|jgi:alpha-L-fucosidase|nr:alpha-L-fucosidase [Dysgonamonadaceae bacterium]
MNKNLPMFFSLFAALSLLFSCKGVLPPQACGAVPTENQLAWHEREQYAFIHFTTNTFTDKEWGYGDEPESVFNPTDFNAEQWAQTCRDAGLKGIVLTCKHHDGFCLWNSAYTEHSVKNSPWLNGKGDVVKAVSDACRKYGLFFGIYLSPWDRNHAEYANPEYISYYRNQLTELLTHYGEVSEIWLDGANGGDGYYGGANEKRKITVDYYDWRGTIELIRRLAPKAVVFSDAGPDVRWCGNESGFAGETNWCNLSLDTLYPGKPDIMQLLNNGEENGTSWTPAEVDVSIRPGWFYHASEDDRVKSPEKLFQIYMQSVGRGANLLLNLPPDRRGLLNERDVDSLKMWKKRLDETFATNLAANCDVKADSYRGKVRKFAAKNATDGDKETYWATDDKVTVGTLEMAFEKPIVAKYILIQEYIRLGQRVKAFEIEAKKGGVWEKIAGGTTIGYKRILPLDNVETSAIRLKITDSKACPLISNVEVF